MSTYAFDLDYQLIRFWTLVYLLKPLRGLLTKIISISRLRPSLAVQYKVIFLKWSIIYQHRNKTGNKKSLIEREELFCILCPAHFLRRLRIFLVNLGHHSRYDDMWNILVHAQGFIIKIISFDLIKQVLICYQYEIECI